MAKKQISAADYISGLIGMSDKSQRQIAAEIGYTNPNMITMLKQGRTQVPINKVGPLAKSLGVDPVHLLRVVLSEKTPEVWEIIQDIVGANAVMSQPEVGLIDFSRQQLGGVELDLHDDELINDLGKAFTSFANRKKAELERSSKEVKRGPKAS